MKKIVAIVGQTSSGKSDLAIRLAKFFDGEIVSADSRQVYKGLDWCSGKVTKDEQNEIKHHLIDVQELGKQFSLFDYQKLAYKAIDEILAKNKLPFLVGGTGLYSRAVIEGYNLSETSPNLKLRQELESKSIDELIEICSDKGIALDGELTKRRLIRKIETFGKEKIENSPRFEVLQIGIACTKEEIYQKIKVRLEKRMPHMIEEIKSLLSQGIKKDFLMTLGLEAKHIILYLDGEYKNFEEFFEILYKEERHFAKRQKTWYNKEKNIVWLEANENLFENAKKLITEFINKN